MLSTAVLLVFKAKQTDCDFAGHSTLSLHEDLTIDYKGAQYIANIEIIQVFGLLHKKRLFPSMFRWICMSMYKPFCFRLTLLSPKNIVLHQKPQS